MQLKIRLLKSGILVFILSLHIITYATPPEVAWSAQDRGLAISLSSDGHVYFVDYEYNPAGDIYLKKYTTGGDSVWTVRYDQTNGSKWEQAHWVVTDKQNNIIVAGTLKSGYSNPVNAASILMKFSPSGELLWRKVYETDFDGSYTRRCLVDEQNNIYVLGAGPGPKGFTTNVKQFKPDGERGWAYFDTLGIGAPQNFKFSQDSAIVIAGRGITGSVNGFAKISRNGTLLWAKAPVLSLTAGDIAGDIAGNSYIINDNYDTNEGSILTKISPEGVVLWSEDAPFSGFRVEVGTDQRPVVSGFPGSGQPGVAMMKWDETGNEIWRNLDADGPLMLLLHAQMLMDEQNNAYLAAGTLFDMAVCKVNSDGTSAWTATIPGSSGAQALTLGNENSIYITGIKTVRLDQEKVSGIFSHHQMVNVLAYPMPAADMAFVPIPNAGKYKFSMYDMTGRIVINSTLQQFSNGELLRIFRDNLPAGYYLLAFESEGSRYISKIIWK